MSETLGNVVSNVPVLGKSAKTVVDAGVGWGEKVVRSFNPMEPRGGSRFLRWFVSITLIVSLGLTLMVLPYLEHGYKNALAGTDVAKTKLYGERLDFARSAQFISGALMFVALFVNGAMGVVGGGGSTGGYSPL
jgi:hypothetical protein